MINAREQGRSEAERQRDRETEHMREAMQRERERDTHTHTPESCKTGTAIRAATCTLGLFVTLPGAPSSPVVPSLPPQSLGTWAQKSFSSGTEFSGDHFCRIRDSREGTDSTQTHKQKQLGTGYDRRMCAFAFVGG